MSEYRRKTLGFVFQFYNLINNLTVYENVETCEYLTDSPLDKDELINTLGLAEHKDKFPYQLSGGQQQRCAIARALIKNPKLLLCDEPTGALPSQASKEILVLLDQINKKYGTTILIVTHNEAISKMVNRVIHITDGKVVKNELNATPVAAKNLVL